MFCPNCGRPIVNGSICPCQQSQQPQQVYASAPQGNPVFEIIRSCGGSVLFMLIAIFYTASLVFSLFGTFLNNAATAYVYRYAMNSFSNASNAIFGATSIIGLAPSVLICIGMWLFFAACRNRSIPEIKTTGLTMIRVVTIVEFVFALVALGIAVLVLLIVALAGASVLNGSLGDSMFKDSSGNAMRALSTIGPAVAVLILVVMAAVIVFVSFWFAKIIKTINTVRSSAHTGIASANVSPFIGVMCFIIGGCSAVSVGGKNPATVLASLCSATVFIMIGILIFSYRGKMRPLCYQSAPVPYGYAQAPQAPVGYAPAPTAQPQQYYQPAPATAPATAPAPTAPAPAPTVEFTAPIESEPQPSVNDEQPAPAVDEDSFLK